MEAIEIAENDPRLLNVMYRTALLEEEGSRSYSHPPTK